ncbi:Protein srek1IP1 [Desmophyllum pertusum]|uniref:Protein srek1IP1 n=1 Tax=Desmophyllum pertusum TaxID=174260 RepID=A0A9W9Z899_9CNID|nr:Protein srek1IP1 [Desmophyllum pertusum]
MTTGTERPSTRVIQVTNIAQNATVDQMKTLFGFLGDIEEMHLFPEDPMVHLGTATRVCFVKFMDPSSVHVAQHLTNTVFIDRALIVVPVQDGTIPDESKAVQLAAPASAVAGGFTGSSGGLLPTPPYQHRFLLFQLATALTVPAPLPPPPPLNNVDPSKIDEIRRTVYVGNLDTTLSAEQLMAFFSGCGEIRYVRMSGDETQPTRFAFVEFSEPGAVNTALQYNGVIFGGRPLKVNHSKNAIVKPATKSSDKDRKDIDKAMRRVKEASSIIEDEIDPGQGDTGPVPGQALVEGDGHAAAHLRGTDTIGKDVLGVLVAERRSKSASPERSPSREKKNQKSEPVDKDESSSKDKKREKSEERTEKRRSKDKERTREIEKERERRKEKERLREKEKKSNGKENVKEKRKSKGNVRKRKNERGKERGNKRKKERGNERGTDQGVSQCHHHQREPLQDSDEEKDKNKRSKRHASAEEKDSESSDHEKSKRKRKKYAEQQEMDEVVSDSERREGRDDRGSGEREESLSRRSKKKSRSYKKKPVSAGDYDTDSD